MYTFGDSVKKKCRTILNAHWRWLYGSESFMLHNTHVHTYTHARTTWLTIISCKFYRLLFILHNMILDLDICMIKNSTLTEKKSFTEISTCMACRHMWLPSWFTHNTIIKLRMQTSNKIAAWAAHDDYASHIRELDIHLFHWHKPNPPPPHFQLSYNAWNSAPILLWLLLLNSINNFHTCLAHGICIHWLTEKYFSSLLLVLFLFKMEKVQVCCDDVHIYELWTPNIAFDSCLIIFHWYVCCIGILIFQFDFPRTESMHLVGINLSANLPSQ